ncbi:FecCD family ABC transporter permease [Ureibacillus sinduriensis]|uniref:Iron ABC transporter permease n=2 Tax=Ureibacillus sinduriensis TaxID=561440 RepID=A0A0A3I0C8_9BACL|nr:iron ABC transporter permease [Ureibacillus sinduriensis]KGR76103.1 iron ABC transporter permease [Ureibacillus sinduriensis BLB-1 = JCM 15800]
MTLNTRKFFGYILFFSILIMILVVYSMNAGYIHIPLSDVYAALTGKGTAANELTILSFRLPRIVIALLVGAGIAVSGAILQGVTKNPIADPGILGINAGAGLAVVLYMFFWQGSAFFSGPLSIFIMPITALIGAFLAAIFIYYFSMKNRVVTVSRLLLVGIGVNAAFNAGLIIFQMKMEPADFTAALVWISGSIWGTNWTYVLALCPWIFIFIPLAIYKANYLNILNLNDSIAIGLGMKLERERRLLLCIAVILAGACVAVGGGITFLGLIITQIVRRLIGANHKKLIPLTALAGALFLLLADTLGRVFMAPAEIPVGLIVSLLGAPYFMYLLIKGR